MNENELNQFRAGSAGLIAALQSAIRGVMKSHPDPTALLQALKFEGEESIAVLLSQNVPDATLEAFREGWNSTVLYPDAEGHPLDPRL